MISFFRNHDSGANPNRRFLDRETAKIDTLVDEQRRLIELLKEKLQAIIFHTVTKGLDPKAPMKDSGVEWLGKVPEGWVVRLRGAPLCGRRRCLARAERAGRSLRPYSPSCVRPGNDTLMVTKVDRLARSIYYKKHNCMTDDHRKIFEIRRANPISKKASGTGTSSALFCL
jgi:hypothetical protein